VKTRQRRKAAPDRSGRVIGPIVLDEAVALAGLRGMIENRCEIATNA
jgi:hypothetical protein